MSEKITITSPIAKLKSGKLLPIVLTVALLIAVGLAGYFYWQTMQLKKDPQALSQKETKQLVDKVSRLMVLPDETPTIATVTDPNGLKDQPFFANAQKGDKVLIYSNAKKAILYRPSANKIIDVAPINTGNAPATAPNTSPK